MRSIFNLSNLDVSAYYFRGMVLLFFRVLVALMLRREHQQCHVRKILAGIESISGKAGIESISGKMYGIFLLCLALVKKVSTSVIFFSCLEFVAPDAFELLDSMSGLFPEGIEVLA